MGDLTTCKDKEGDEGNCSICRSQYKYIFVEIRISVYNVIKNKK